MAHQQSQRPPSLDLISLSAPTRPVSTSPSPTHCQSQSPFHYVQFTPNFPEPDEKATPLAGSDMKQQPSPPTPHSYPRQHMPSVHSNATQTSYPNVPRSARSHHFSSLPPAPSPYSRPSGPLNTSSYRASTYTRPRGLRILNLVKPWIPLILYALTSLAFVVAIALYRTEVFSLLDELSVWLQSDEQSGHAILFFLIFLTTIPPVPLYSTLIVLSGYTFGPWTGALISYFAALAGALVVFIVSRSLLRESISRWLSSYTTIKRVVRAIEKRPKLLFLIRLAPYPYNVMNCLLAASPTLTLHTYTICTALSLFKVIIHTSLGASIHSFRDYHAQPESPSEDDSNANTVARMWTVGGIILCVAILVYLSVVARRAVDDELDDGPLAHDREEIMAFLAPESANDVESAHPVRGRQMTELPSRTPQIMPYRSSHSVGPELNRQWS
ncbi:hypothetical protein BDQ12DRAFT_709155 [Crucibulum laeve]|uniref:Golgi apparatus membrane protein TVP38 n=1 Tax=Crucibulum laeve TaxID=68775 RepID=A0A5C3MEM6_9AGAR|nr:hypothetical protein BDQ12DRAFT_709155 [Crucibulum laeve]